MEKITICNNDYITEMEDIIEKELKKSGFKNSRITMNTPLQTRIYLITIISILQKEEYYEEYIAKYITGTEDIRITSKIRYLLQKLQMGLQNTDYGTMIIKNNSREITKHLERYFNRKNQNYILKEYPLEVIRKIKKSKEFIENNPFVLNQILYYSQNPLSEEEQIIAEIGEIYKESSKIVGNISAISNNPFTQIPKNNETEIKKRILEYTKNTMELIYIKETLDRVIRFILSDTYQEIKEDKNNLNRNIIIPIIENENIKAEDIIKNFIEKDNFSNIFIENFINYNKEIKKGRLEELEHQESYQYAKRIYKKPL